MRVTLARSLELRIGVFSSKLHKSEGEDCSHRFTQRVNSHKWKRYASKVRYLDQMKTDKVTIRFAGAILKRLGEELNPNPEMGIMELVKNSYDADARRCTIRLENVQKAGGTIIIEDDGDGMDLKGIVDGWLVLGSSKKKRSAKTRLGRTPAGNKGLGRLAALRLGRTVKLVSTPRNSLFRYELTIDWAKFDETEIVEDVVLEIETVNKGDAKDGTLITIEGLRFPFSKQMASRLANALILIADPFEVNERTFSPALLTDEYGELEKLIEKRYFDDAEFRLTALLDASGNAEAKAYDWKGELMFSADHGDIRKGNKKEPYRAPGCRFDLWVYLLGKETFSTRRSVSEIRPWLKEFGGVHIYQDGIPVAPYGKSGNDWLEMNLSRARSPEERPSTNTSIGKIAISDWNSQLVQKTDRSGFIENEAFENLREFGKDVLDWLAARRLALAEARRQKKRHDASKYSSETTSQLEKVIKDLPNEKKKEIKKAIDGLAKVASKEIDLLKKEVQLYRTLSTAGIMSATFTHDANGSPLKIIVLSAQTIDVAGRKHFNELYDSYVAAPIQQIRNAVDSLSVLGVATMELLHHEKRRVGIVNLHETIDRILKSYLPFLQGRGIEIEKLFAQNSTPRMNGTEAALESIVTNLLNNSINILEGLTKEIRLIRVRTEIVDESMFHIEISDSGPGIMGISLADIWLPGKTTRSNGTGLGLTIVRDAVADLGGDVSAYTSSDIGGAKFLVELPLLINK